MNKILFFLLVTLTLPFTSYAGKKDQEDEYDKKERIKQEQRHCDALAEVYYFYKDVLANTKTELGREKILRDMRITVKEYKSKCLEKDYINAIELN